MKPSRPSSIHGVRHREMVALLVKTRVEAGVSQTELANALALKQPDVSKIENNERRLDVIEFFDVIKYISIRSGNPGLAKELVNILLNGEV